MKTASLLAASILATATVTAGVITFDAYTPLYDQTIPIVTEGFTFTGNAQGVWSGPGVPPGADNGTQHLIWGFSSLTFGQTGGGPFHLVSLELGMSWYLADSTAEATITSTLAGGGTSSMNVQLNRSFQSFNVDLDVTSVEISSPALTSGASTDINGDPNGNGGGYFAMDNVNVVVPEPAASAWMAASLVAVAGFAARRRFSKS